MLYPPIKPRRSGLLDIGDGHELYWEESGNPAGWPVVVLHGGPGGNCTERSRRWFHPDYFRIVTFDQRGCGRSRPHASIAHNTTTHLVADLEALRRMLACRRWIIMGRSWGAALAIAYAESHPHRVDAMIVSGVFTARQFERDWLYSPEEGRTCQAVMNGGCVEEQRAAAQRWCRREDRVASMQCGAPPLDDRTALARARIGAHYFVNHYFLAEGQLLAHAHRLRGLPGSIVQGRADLVTPPITACHLHRAWPGSRLQLVADAGHAASDPPLMRALVDAADAMLPNERGWRPPRQSVGHDLVCRRMNAAVRVR